MGFTRALLTIRGCDGSTIYFNDKGLAECYVNMLASRFAAPTDADSEARFDVTGVADS